MSNREQTLQFPWSGLGPGELLLYWRLFETHRSACLSPCQEYLWI